jgi:acyl-coenzyme A synthetase/AMP-(fatty) acid ligase
VVGINDDITGYAGHNHSQAIVCFCTLKSDNQDIAVELKNQVRSHIGPFAQPKLIVLVPDLPKTRSGKIMRRILRKIAGKEVTIEDARDPAAILEKLGDTSTLADPSIVVTIIECFNGKKP